jgi:hypothetical protein
VYVTGSQPTSVSSLHGGSETQVASWDAPEPAAQQQVSAAEPVRARPRRPVMAQKQPDAEAAAAPAAAEEKKGMFGRISDWFRRKQ